jgi:hypothetical protein
MAELVEHLAAKDLRHGADGEEKSPPGWDPCLVFDVECTAGHDEVDVGMVGEGLAPRVEHGEEAELPFEAVSAELEQRLRCGAKEGLVEPGAGDGRDVDKRRGQGEDDVEIGDGDEVLLLLLDPVEGTPLETPPSVPVAAGVIGGDLVATGIERPMAAESRGATGDDAVDGAALLVRRDVLAQPGRAVKTHDIRHAKARRLP